MKEQGQGQQGDTSSNMAAAAAAAYHQDSSHVPPAHAPLGLDHHHFQGPQHSLMFGDATLFHYDTSSHDQVLPPEHHNSQAILESSDVDFLNTFFSDPDSLNQIQLSPYDFPPEDKSAANNNVFSAATFDPHGGANGTINPSTLAPSQASLHKTSHMNNHMPFAAPPQNAMAHQAQSHTPQQQPHPNMSAADYTAANTIHNFKSTPTQNFAQPNTQGGFSGASSWGNFMMPNPPPSGMGVDVSFQHTQSGGSGGTRHGSFTNNRNVMYFQGIPQQVPTAQLQRGYSVDSSSQYLQDQQQARTWQQSSQSPSSHGPTRPSTVSFGSDPLFEAGHYRNPTPTQHDKSGNLVNIPYAAQAAQAGMRHGSVSAQRESGSEPARKRRKSQADRDEEAEWAPDASGSKAPNAEDSGEEAGGDGQPKRRKPSLSRQVSSVVSPQVADENTAQRGVKKPRETLTEQQKRQHHIQSEKKRREIINQGYSDLNILVPCLNGGKSGLSRSECLQESASYIEALISGTAHIMEQLGLTDADLKAAAPITTKQEYGT